MDQKLTVLEFKKTVDDESLVSPESLLQDAIAMVSTIDALILLSVEDSGNVTIGYTNMNLYELAGFLDTARASVIDQIRGK